MNLNIITCTADDLPELYADNAFTMIGFDTSKDNLNDLIKWLNIHNCHMVNPDIYVISGELMNVYYGLTGNNAYPDDLHIVCIRLADLDNVPGIIIPRFQIGGRWFNDVVDNNARRNRDACD